MKKAIAFILLLCFMISCVSCDFNIFDKNDSESEASSSSKESYSSSKESESSVESSSSVSEESSESESSSSSSESSSSTESESSSESAVIVPITEFGQFSSAITSTKKSDDRLKQMALSSTFYDKGALSSYSESDLNSIKSSANSIVLGGSLVSYKNASAFMKHFLNNTGEDYEIDMSVFLSDTAALETRDSELTKALRACEALAVEGESISVYQNEELVHHNLTGDWKYAIGSYFTAIEVKNLTVEGNIYHATFVYKVTDFYNWDEGDSNAVFSGALASFTKNVSPKDLHQLHRAGMAKEFLSHGEITYTVSWVKGSSVSSIIAFK